MTTATQGLRLAPARTARGDSPMARRTLTRAASRADLTAGALAATAGTGLGVLLAAALETSLPAQLSAVWALTLIGRLTAVAGTYGALWMVLLVARVPPIERAIGHDRLVALHKRIGPWSIWLIGVHVLASVMAWALPESATWWGELWSITTTQRWILAADAGVLMLIAAGVTSRARARRRLPRQVWWTVHLYTYLAIALAFAHQITVDGPFVTGWARAVWIALYVVLAALVLGYRVLLPLERSLHHDLRVAKVVRESRDVVSVWVAGRDLDGLRVRPGQFAQWRFLTDGLAYESHPYSFSAPARGDLMRVTVKDLGDGSALTARLRPGTRVLMEGPYGVMTPERVCATGRAVLVAGGVGVAPARALAEGLASDGARVDVVVRASDAGDLPLIGELEAFATWPNVRLHTLVGHRDVHPMDALELHALVPDLAACDLYVCGPVGLVDVVARSAERLGLPEDRLHVEDFTM